MALVYVSTVSLHGFTSGVQNKLRCGMYCILHCSVIFSSDFFNNSLFYDGVFSGVFYSVFSRVFYNVFSRAFYNVFSRVFYNVFSRVFYNVFSAGIYIVLLYIV